METNLQSFTMSPETDKMFTALSAALPEIPTVPLNGKAQFGNHKLIDDILEAVKPVFKKHNLFIMLWPKDTGLMALIGHSSGQYMRGEMQFPDKDTNNRQTNQHARGGDITYFRRYMLESILGIAGDEDTDGHYPQQQPQKKEYQYEQGRKITEAQLKLLNDLINKRADHVAARTKILDMHGITTLAELEASAASELIGKLKQ